MKYPKRGFNRIRKSLVPDKPVTVDPVPKKHYPSLGKTSPNDWRRRWFLGAIILALLSGMPILAQDATSAGPVHSPGSQIVIPSNATPATPMAASTSPAPAAAVSGDIHDIRGPISIPYQWLWVAYFVGGVIVAAVIYGAWCALRRKKAPVKLPFEIALERLEAARARMTAETVREYAFEVSEIIRVYIEQRFGEKAARRTTEEFLFDLVQQTDSPLAPHRRRLEDFMGHCDLMKFAKWQASVPELEAMHESAREFILETRPQPQPAKTAKDETPVQPQPELLHVK
jgi:hypothetical protein